MAKTKQAKEPKEKFILIKTAAKKYDTAEKNILNWAKTRKITACRIGNTWVVDDNSIKTYIDLNKQLSDYDLYLNEQIKEKEKLIQKFDNEIFQIKNLYELTPAFQIVLYEMSVLISNPQKQVIFLDMVIGGKNINTIAQEHKTTINKIIRIQQTNVKTISAKSGFLKTFRETMAGLKFKIRELEINNQAKENEINRLLSILPSIEREEPEVITPEIVKLLSTPLYSLPFEKRALNCFNWYNVHTVEDLLRLTKGKGFKILTYQRSFGKKSLASLKAILIENNIINTDEDSYLYKFV